MKGGQAFCLQHIMTLRQLQHFENLARTQHYQRSAELLGISQPALSRSISSLELELGAPLFEKQGRNVVLNRFGRVFAEHIFTAIHEIDTGAAHLRDMTDPRKGVIEMSLNYATSNIYLPRILRAYMAGRNQDELTFQFRQSNTPAILTDVREGISELGLCSYMEDQPEILLYPVVRCPLLLLAPPGHALARREQASLQEISRYPMIFQSIRLTISKTCSILRAWIPSSPAVWGRIAPSPIWSPAALACPFFPTIHNWRPAVSYGSHQ